MRGLGPAHCGSGCDLEGPVVNVRWRQGRYLRGLIRCASSPFLVVASTTDFLTFSTLRATRAVDNDSPYDRITTVHTIELLQRNLVPRCRLAPHDRR